MKSLSTFSALLVGLTFGLFLSLASCGGGAGSCQKTCGGCCTAAGICESGTANSSCGKNGAICSPCGAGLVCGQGACTIQGSTGGGSGTAGSGGTAGGAGATAGGAGATAGGAGATAGGAGATAGGAGATAGGAGATAGGAGATAGGAGATAGGSGTAGSGGTAGGSGTGGAGNCTQFASITMNAGGGMSQTEFNNGFTWAWAFSAIQSTTAMKAHFAGFEVYYPNGSVPAAPRGPITFGATTYSACTDCLMFDFDCDFDGSNCAKRYLGQMGSFSITSQNLMLTGGSMAGSATNVRFVEWDFAQGADRAVVPGSCIDVASLTFNATW